jgi:hypothetical protein
MTTIVIDKETRTKLRNIGRKDQTYDDIISELIRKTKKGPANSGKLAGPMEL